MTTFILVDRSKVLVNLFNKMFHDVRDVRAVYVEDIFDYNPRGRPIALVSPGNSSGWMDGGIEDDYVRRFGTGLEKRVQELIESRYYGELVVGCADSVLLDSNRWGYDRLIIAPTMLFPANVRNTMNAYLAFRAILIHAREEGIRTVVCPGLCTGIGEMSPRDMCMQMRDAWDSFNESLRRRGRCRRC